MRSFAVVPAAGRSVRMGRPKLLLPWQGQPIIQHVLSAWQASRVTQTVVVLHRDDTELIQLCRSTGVEVVVPAEPPPEMKISIAHALERIVDLWQPDPRTDAWLLAPADMPHLSTSVIDHLLSEHQTDLPAILVPEYNTQRGHPVLFPWSTANDIPQLGPDQGVNAIVAHHGWTPIPINDPHLLHDLDTPTDYQNLTQPPP